MVRTTGGGAAAGAGGAGGALAGSLTGGGRGDRARGGAGGSAEFEPARRIADLFARMSRAQQHDRRGTVIGLADLRILWLLDDDRARTLKEIAADLHLEQSTVNRQVNAALSAGLVQRERAEQGVYRFTPTAEGRRRFDERVELSLGAYRDALAALGPQEAARFLDLLDTFTRAYGDVIGSADDYVPDPRRE